MEMETAVATALGPATDSSDTAIVSRRPISATAMEVGWNLDPTENIPTWVIVNEFDSNWEPDSFIRSNGCDC